MPGEEIAFTARLKIHSHSQIFRYGRSIFCLPHRPKFSDFFDLFLHWMSIVRVVQSSGNNVREMHPVLLAQSPLNKVMQWALFIKQNLNWFRPVKKFRIHEFHKFKSFQFLPQIGRFYLISLKLIFSLDLFL